MLAADARRLAADITAAGGSCELAGLARPGARLPGAARSWRPRPFPPCAARRVHHRSRCAATASIRLRGRRASDHHQAQPRRRRRRHRRRQRHRRRVRHRTRRRGGRIVCSDIDVAPHGRRRTPSSRQVARPSRCAATSPALDDVQQLAEEAQAWFGGAPTLVVNNAGVGAGGTAIGERRLDDWQLDARHQPVGTDPRLPRVRPDPARSRSARRHHQRRLGRRFGAAPGMAAYNVSKAGVLSLSETLAAELSRHAASTSPCCARRS